MNDQYRAGEPVQHRPLTELAMPDIRTPRKQQWSAGTWVFIGVSLFFILAATVVCGFLGFSAMVGLAVWQPGMHPVAH